MKSIFYNIFRVVYFVFKRLGVSTPAQSAVRALSWLCKAHARPLEALANEAKSDQTTALIGLGNEIDLSANDGWALISPYGDWPHEQGIQRVTRSSAEEMVRRFKSTMGRIKRAVVGLPLFNGHPDHASFANTHKDKTEYGQFSDLQARDDGFWGKPVLSSAGADLVEAGKKYLSPNWRAAVVGMANGIRIFEPVILDSVGLTATPNIPGKSLANTASPAAANNQTTTTMIPQWILTLLGLAADATEEQVKTALTALTQRPAPDALANEQTARTTAEGKIAAAEQARAAAETALANEKTGRTAESAARIALLLDAAQKESRITPANRAAWQTRLETNFDAESTALANEKPALKTNATTGDLGQRKTAAATEGTQNILSLVNEKMATAGVSALPAAQRFDAAYKAVKRERPDLFGEKKTA